MNTDTDIDALKQTLVDLRKSFDESFYHAPILDEIEKIQVLLFSLGQECFAISLNYIQHILIGPEVTIVPCAPQTIRGVMNLNGEIVSVSDVRNIFNLESTKLNANSRVLVTKNLDYTTGICIEDVIGTIFVENDLKPGISTLPNSKSELIQGTFFYNERLVTLFDMEKLSACPEMRID